LAIGIFNAGANVGAIITPLIVPVVTIAWGWRSAFVLTGLVSLVWLVAWLIVYRSPREHPRLTVAELRHIESDPTDPTERIPWSRLLRRRETWAFAAGKFLTDPIWWFYLFWLPDFLAKRYHLDLLSFGPPLVAVYLMSDGGSVLGGMASSRLMRRGVSVNRARKYVMLGCALLVTPVFFTQHLPHLWPAVFVVGLAAAAHQAWSANLYALPSDMFPRSAVGSVIGIGGTAGALGGMLMAKAVGYALDVLHSYTIVFATAAAAYLVALLVVHLLAPRLARVAP
jgi:ACS family hexuronate transporter-like MFS transporter